MNVGRQIFALGLCNVQTKPLYEWDLVSILRSGQLSATSHSRHGVIQVVQESQHTETCELTVRERGGSSALLLITPGQGTHVTSCPRVNCVHA